MTRRPARKPVDVVTRRRFLKIGGTLSMGAVLAACIGGGSTKRSPDSSGGAGGRKADATILRTLSSVEAVAVVVYTTALDAGLLTTRPSPISPTYFARIIGSTHRCSRARRETSAVHPSPVRTRS